MGALEVGENLKTTLTTGVNEQDGRTSQLGRASKFASTSSLFVGLGCHGCFHFHFVTGAHLEFLSFNSDSSDAPLTFRMALPRRIWETGGGCAMRIWRSPVTAD